MRSVSVLLLIQCLCGCSQHPAVPRESGPDIREIEVDAAQWEPRDQWVAIERQDGTADPADGDAMDTHHDVWVPGVGADTHSDNDTGSFQCPDTDEWPTWGDLTPDLITLSEQYCKTVARCDPSTQDICLPIVLSLAPLGDPAVFAAWLECQLKTMSCPKDVLSVTCLLASAQQPPNSAKLAICDALAASMDLCLFTGGDKNLAYVQCLQLVLSPYPMCGPRLCTEIDVTPDGNLPPLPPPPSASCAKFELCLTHTLNLANNPAWGSGP